MATTPKSSGKSAVEIAQDAMLKGIANLVNDKPQEVIALLKQFKRPLPENPTNVDLGNAIAQGFAVPDFMGALVIKANDYSMQHNSADGEDWNNAASGGKAAGMSGNMIADIANAVGNFALAAAQITASVKEVEKAKVEQKSKLIEFITKKDDNKSAKQIAAIQAQTTAYTAALANANKPVDNTPTYVALGVIGFLVLVGGGIALMKKNQSA